MTAATSTQTDHILLGVGLRAGSVALLACMMAIVKWAGEHGVPVFEIILFRNLFAFVPLGVYVWRTTGFGVLRTRRPLAHATRAGIGLVGMISSFWALKFLPLTEATALQFSAPLFMTALSALLLSEKVGWRRWAAVAAGFAGVLLMARPIPGHLNVPGVALGLLSAVGLAGAMVAVRQISATERAPTIVFYFTLAGAIAGVIGSAFGWVTPGPKLLALLVLAGVLGGAGQLLATEALRLAPLGVVAPFDYAQLVWAALLGVLIWGEFPHPLTVVGAVIVAGSGLYILHRELRRVRAEGAPGQVGADAAG